MGFSKKLEYLLQCKNLEVKIYNKFDLFLLASCSYTHSVICQCFSMHISDCSAYLQKLLILANCFFKFSNIIKQYSCAIIWSSLVSWFSCVCLIIFLLFMNFTPYKSCVLTFLFIWSPILFSCWYSLVHWLAVMTINSWLLG